MTSSSSGHRLRILSVLMLRGTGAVLYFIITLVLARLLGAAGVGVFLFFQSTMRLLGTVMALGFPQFALRTVATRANWSRPDYRARELIYRCLARVGAIGAGLAFVITAASGLFATHVFEDTAIRLPLAAAAVGAVPLALLLVQADALKGHGEPQWGIVGEFVIAPFLVLAAVGVAVAALDVFEVAYAIGIFVAAHVLAVVTIHVVMHRKTTPAAEPITQRPPLPTRTLLAFMTSATLNVALWTSPYLILPAFTDSAELGMFGVAHRLVAIASISLVAINSHFGPIFSRARVAHDRPAAHSALNASCGYSLLASLPLFAVFLLAPEIVLGFFGPEFRHGRSLLFILLAGAVINSITGLSSEFLQMTRGEFVDLTLTALSVAVLVVGGSLAAQASGATGMAMVVSAVMAGRNLLAHLYCRVLIRRW